MDNFKKHIMKSSHHDVKHIIENIDKDIEDIKSFHKDQHTTNIKNGSTTNVPLINANAKIIDNYQKWRDNEYQDFLQHNPNNFTDNILTTLTSHQDNIIKICEQYGIESCNKNSKQSDNNNPSSLVTILVGTATLLGTTIYITKWTDKIKCNSPTSEQQNDNQRSKL